MTPLTRTVAFSARAVVAAVAAAICVGAAGAQVPDEATRPVVTLRYKELTNREDFKFVVEKKGEYSKPVGDMNFEFPEGFAPSAGLAAAQRTFCIEPLVPIFAGRTYDFAVGPINDPASYGLPDTAEGKVAAERRATYLRELYGRYYADTTEENKVATAGFQMALWEIAGETQVPEGPLPFNLFTGAFKANYPNEAEAPESVRTAQRYLQSLTGDDAPFREAVGLQGLELVRLNGLAGADGLAPQSQVALRAAPGGLAAAGGGNGAGGSGGFAPSASPIGGGGGLGGGGGGGFGPLGGLGGRGTGGGGGGSPIGGLGGLGTAFPVTTSLGTTTSPVVTTVTAAQPGGTSPQESTGTVTSPPPIRPAEIIPPTPPGGNPPGGTPPGGNPPEVLPPEGSPVPAPPAVVLVLLGAAGLWATRRSRRTLEA